jgi:phosphohistidine phosphatase SixA
LNEEGKDRVAKLTKLIREQGMPEFNIVSSPENAAMQTAWIIAGGLKVRFVERCPDLTSGEFSYIEGANFIGDAKRVQAIVDARRSDANTLILVTHSEVSENFPNFFL